MEEFEIKIPITLEDKTSGGAVVEKLDDAINDAAKSAEKLGAAMEKATHPRDANGRFGKMGAEIDKSTRSSDKFGESIKKTHMQVLKMAQEKIQMVISAIDRASPILNGIWGGLKNMGGKAWNVTVKMVDMVTAPLRGAVSWLTKLTGLAGVAGTALGALSLKSAFGESAEQARMNAQLNVSALNMGIDASGVAAINQQAQAIAGKTMYTDTAMVGAAAELATYFDDAKAISRMMETVTDYAAGMSGGVELSTDQIVDYTTNLAKMTTGAYDAMTKKGFEVTKMQKKILETGTDMEKVAVIESIIQENWEGMAQAFANTPTGILTRLKNDWGEISETIGDKLMPRAGQFFGMLHERLPRIAGLIEGGADALFAWADKVLPHVGTWIDGTLDKFEGFGGAISDLFGSNEFQDADLFGKISISWNKLIAEPFDAWWSSSGQGQITGFAQQVGNAFGETLKGLMMGAASFLTGQDFTEGSGIKLSGMAKAGIETGKAFGSSFLDGISGIGEKIPAILGGIIKNAFGVFSGGGAGSFLSAMLVGKSAATLGGGMMQTVKTVSDLKTALLGTQTAATASAAGAGKAVAMWGGLKGVLAAIPGWGWAAAAAVTAAAVGVKLYNDHVERQRQELIHMGDAVNEASESFSQAQQNLQSFDDLASERKQIERAIHIAKTGLPQDELEALEKKYADAESKTATLTYDLQRTGLTLDQINEYVSAFTQIEDGKKTVLASIIARSTEGADGILDLMTQYKDAGLPEEMKREIEAKILATANTTPENGEKILALMEKYRDANLDPFEMANILASLTALSTDTDEAKKILEVMKKYDGADLTSNTAEIVADLTAACGNEEEAKKLLPLFQQYAALEDEKLNLTADLTMTLPEGTNVNQVIADLKELSALTQERNEIKLTLDAANMNPNELQGYEEKLAAINQALIESSDGLISQYDAENGRLEEKLALLKKHLEVQEQIALQDLKNTVEEKERQMPKLQGEMEEKQRQIDENRQQQEQYGAKTFEPLIGLNDEYKLLHSQYQGAVGKYTDGDGNITDYAGYEQESAKWLPQFQDMAEKFRTLGEQLPEADQMTLRLDQVTGESLLGGQSEEFDGKTAFYREGVAQLQSELPALLAELATMKQSQLDVYDGKKKVLEGEQFGGSALQGKTLEDAAALYNTMNAGDRELFRQAMDAFTELNAGTDYLGADEKISAQTLWNTAHTSNTGYDETRDGPMDTRKAIGNLQMRNEMNENRDTFFTQQLKENEEAYAAAQGQGDTAALDGILNARQAIFNDQYNAIIQAQLAVAQLDEQIASAWEQLSEAQAKGAQVEEAKANVEEVSRTYGSMGVEERDAYSQSKEGQAALDGVNAALEGLNLEKIASLDELSAAMERINGAESANNDTIAALSASLESLSSDKADALVSIANGLDTVAFNMDRLKEAKIADALKVGDNEIGRFGTLATKIGDVKAKVDETTSSLSELEGNYAVTVSVNYVFSQTGSKPTFSVAGDEPKFNAAGGIYGRGAFLSWVAESGAEAIIPLEGQYRDRGIDLWMQAGQELGVMENAAGGVYGDTEGGGDGFSVDLSPGNSGGAAVYYVSIENNPVFEITGGGDVVNELREAMGELMDELGEQMAEALEAHESNA